VHWIFSETKKLPVAALSHTLPEGVMLQLTLFSGKRRWNCSPVYVLPLVEVVTARRRADDGAPAPRQTRCQGGDLSSEFRHTMDDQMGAVAFLRRWCAARLVGDAVPVSPGRRFQARD
jgi:hypothetical protein